MKIRFYAKKIILAMAIWTPLWATEAKDFIFDFGGVLIFTNTMSSFKHIGMMNVAECMIRLGINPLTFDQHIKTTFFTVLDQVAQIHHLDGTDSFHQTYDEKGNKMPFLMCTWLQGAMTSAEVKSLVEQEISLHPEWFGCQAEQRVIQNTIRLVFTPEFFVNSRKISQAGIAFIKKCKREGHNVYGLSNWDAESFALLKQRHPELFDLFDGIIISGHVHANKPHASIYQILLERYELKAENCWFIDDQQENIDAAQKLGINAIRHTSTFQNTLKHIRLAYSKSTRRENFKNNGISETTIKTNNNAMIDGEKISLTDSTKYNCLPANA